MRLVAFEDEAAWIEAVLADLEGVAAEARAACRRRLDLCLAGGTTPGPVYAALAASKRAAAALAGLPVGLWLGDEREVGPSDAARNGLLVAKAFAAAIWSPRPEFLPWPDGLAAAAAADYEALLAGRLGPQPAFDLVLLGLGADGHTASLFPGDPILDEKRRLAAPSLAPAEPRRRMSLTFGAFALSRRLRFLVRGPDKAAIVAALAAEEPALPASRLAKLPDAAIYHCRPAAP